MNNLVKTTEITLVLSLACTKALAGTYSVVYLGGINTEASYDRGEYGLIRDWDDSSPFAPILKLAADPNHAASEFHATYLYQLVWTPSYSGEVPSNTMPLASFQVDAQLWGTGTGASASIQDFNQNTLLNSLAQQDVWQPIGSTYVQVSDDLLPASDGTYRAPFNLDTLSMNCSGANGAYGHGHLRYTYTGMVD